MYEDISGNFNGVLASNGISTLCLRAISVGAFRAISVGAFLKRHLFFRMQSVIFVRAMPACETKLKRSHPPWLWWAMLVYLARLKGSLGDTERGTCRILKKYPVKVPGLVRLHEVIVLQLVAMLSPHRKIDTVTPQIWGQWNSDYSFQSGVVQPAPCSLAFLALLACLSFPPTPQVKEHLGRSYQVREPRWMLRATFGNV